MNRDISAGQKLLPKTCNSCENSGKIPTVKFIFQVRNLQICKNWTLLYYSCFTGIPAKCRFFLSFKVSSCNILRILQSLSQMMFPKMICNYCKRDNIQGTISEILWSWLGFYFICIKLLFLCNIHPSQKIQ